MAFFDLALEELQNYRPERSEPGDFDLFWTQTLSEARSFPLAARFEPCNFGLRTIETYDLTFNGFGGQPIKGWFSLPVGHVGRLPCVVEYIGYGGGRSFPTDWLLYPSAGFAYLLMDTRGQGSSWAAGATPDLDLSGGSPHYPGFMTQGVLDPHTYYYRRLYTDAVRAVDAALSHPAVDPERIAITGISQGGGLTLAVSGLHPEIRAALPDVPFLCDFRRAASLVDTHPYHEIARFCKTHRDKVEQVFNTLAYFDGINFAARASAPSLFSTALMDDTCPPSTVFAAYNHYAGPKAIKVYEYNQHEGGGSYQALEKLRFLNQLWSER